MPTRFIWLVDREHNQNRAHKPMAGVAAFSCKKKAWNYAHDYYEKHGIVMSVYPLTLYDTEGENNGKSSAQNVY